MAHAPTTQTTAAKLLSELWAAQPEYAVNNTRGVTKSIWDTGETYFGPGFKVNFPIVEAIPATALGAAMSVAIANSVAGTPTEVEVTPTVTYAAMILLEDVLLTTAYDTVRTYTPALAEALYQQIDIDILAQAVNFTTNSQTDGGAFTEGNFHTLVSKILTNGGDKVQLGQLDGWYHPQMWDTIMGIADFYTASVRGESNSSAKTGNVGMAFGVNFNFTKNVLLSTTLRNVILSKKSIVLVRKNRPKIEMERTDLSTRVVASTMYACKVLHETTGGVHIVTTTT